MKKRPGGNVETPECYFVAVASETNEVAANQRRMEEFDNIARDVSTVGHELNALSTRVN